MEQKFKEIDEILASYEDWMHGNNGEQCTKARKLLREVQQQLNAKLDIPIVTGKRKDNNEYVTGSLMYDFDQDCWRIITYFFDIEEPKLDNQFGVCAHEVYLNTVEPCL